MIKLEDIKLGDKLELKENGNSDFPKWWPCTVWKITHALRQGKPTTDITVDWQGSSRTTTVTQDCVDRFLRVPQPDPGSLVGGVAQQMAISQAQAQLIKELEGQLASARTEVGRLTTGQATVQGLHDNARRDLARATADYSRTIMERDDYQKRLGDAIDERNAARREILRHENALASWQMIEEQWHKRTAEQKSELDDLRATSAKVYGELQATIIRQGNELGGLRKIIATIRDTASIKETT